MVFLSRKKEIQDIKKAVEGGPAPPPPAPDSYMPPMPPSRPVSAFEYQPVPSQPSSNAPLFVKIESYNSVLDKFERTKEEIRNLTNLLALMASIEETRKNTETAIKDHIARLTDVLLSLDTDFVKPEVAKGFVRDHGVAKSEVERYVSDLQRELKYLKEELSKIG